MDQDEHDNHADFRGKSRVRAFLRAEIMHSNGASRTECTVRDLSESGARIEVPASVTIPEFFELFIPLKGLRKRARIMWRAGNELGIAFVEEPAKPAHESAAKSESDMEVRIRLLELEAETARLRLQVTEMQQMVNTLMKDRGAA